MKIIIKNLGVIKQAEFSLGELTIICGSNNTGKTYATYALYGFLSYWHEAFSIEIDGEDIQRLLKDGNITLDIQQYIDNAQSIIDRGCSYFNKQFPVVFASNEKYFTDTSFSIILDDKDIIPVHTFDRTTRAGKSQLFSISKKSDSLLVTISLLVEKDDVKIPHDIINKSIGFALKEIVFNGLFPHPFISSAERTGAAIFRKELYFARNRLLEEMSSMEKNLDPFTLLSKVYSDYALPVRDNVDFTRRLEEYSKKESFIAKEYPELLEDFTDIIGGGYFVKDNELHYIPKGKRIRLTMDESSSSVRSLLDIGFYLRHTAKRGDLFMVDEPEMNLHPENQRRMARLFARLVNIGINVFITTHSDYIIKELNTLIMLNQSGERLNVLAEREGYKDTEKLNTNKVKVYIAEESLIMLDDAPRRKRVHTLISADISAEYGIEIRSFDKTIEDMNRIQEEIIWGDEQ